MIENDKIRKPNRYQNFDYSTSGAYFITICTQDKKCIFWCRGDYQSPVKQISDIKLSAYGEIANKSIKKISSIYPDISIEHSVIMPNHIHLIIRINKLSGRLIIAPTVAQIIKGFKTAVTKQIGKSIWQKSYYDRIIRNDKEYQEVYNYIIANPYNWQEDEYYA